MIYKKIIFKFVLSLLALSFLTSSVTSCGVKGDPLPPFKKTELGRGEPTYKRATQELDLPDTIPEENILREDEEDY